MKEYEMTEDMTQNRSMWHMKTKMQMGVGGCHIFWKKHYEDVRYNVISVTRGWVGVQFPGKKHYVTLEWPQSPITKLQILIAKLQILVH